MTKPSILALAVSALLLSTGAHAAAPVISGNFGSGTFTGSVKAESYDFSLTNAENWSFWTFDADFLTEVEITVTPSDSMFDPIIGVWYGVETDTLNYFGNIADSSLNTVFVAGADGSSSFSLGGPGEAATVRFTNLYGSGPFVLAIADWQDNVGPGIESFNYTITASVPEPEAWAQLALGLGLLGGFARVRRNRAR
jgi:hypothetical protein